jgi:hypothetical protein
MKGDMMSDQNLNKLLAALNAFSQLEEQKKADMNWLNILGKAAAPPNSGGMAPSNYLAGAGFFSSNPLTPAPSPLNPAPSPFSFGGLAPAFADRSPNSLAPAASPLAAALGEFAAPSAVGTLGRPTTSYRTRSSWNDRFFHWEKPASVTEEGTIERAERHVIDALGSSEWLVEEGVCIAQQGSYLNNTNVRIDADIDLRAIHPVVKVRYHPDVNQQHAYRAMGYTFSGVTDEEVFSSMRKELHRELAEAFGWANVTPGTKAYRIKGITGSRAEVDVVPTINSHYVYWSATSQTYKVNKGVAILSTDGRWTYNYPEQHNNNGIAKRARTKFRFKKIVRTFKQLRTDMKDCGVLQTKVPSFLIECLVYMVEDKYFLVEGDDKFDRVRRIALRMKSMLRDTSLTPRLREINGIKLLFNADQNWTLATAIAFANAAVTHLGDA